MAKKDIISQSLGLEPMIDPPAKITDAVTIIKAEKNNDYEYARKNLYDIIEKGQNALEDIIDIAKQSESARAFEVATNLIKTMADANKDLLNLAKAKKELEKEDVPEQKNITNNNLVLTSADLLKMIKDRSHE
jgi:Terminase DNA packaging enzyme